jgi:V8-like Glu-specific endopeptidase
MVTIKKLIHETVYWGRKTKMYRMSEDFKNVGMANKRHLKYMGKLHKAIQKILEDDKGRRKE